MESFANPQWSFLIWIVIAVVVVLFLLDRRGANLLDRFLSPAMRIRLVHRMPVARLWLSIVLLGLSALCLVVALMRPQWGSTFVERQRRAGARPPDTRISGTCL